MTWRHHHLFGGKADGGLLRALVAPLPLSLCAAEPATSRPRGWRSKNQEASIGHAPIHTSQAGAAVASLL